MLFASTTLFADRSALILHRISVVIVRPSGIRDICCDQSYRVALDQGYCICGSMDGAWGSSPLNFGLRESRLMQHPRRRGAERVLRFSSGRIPGAEAVPQVIVSVKLERRNLNRASRSSYWRWLILSLRKGVAERNPKEWKKLPLFSVTDGRSKRSEIPDSLDCFLTSHDSVRVSRPPVSGSGLSL